MGDRTARVSVHSTVSGIWNSFMGERREEVGTNMTVGKMIGSREGTSDEGGGEDH